MTMLSVPLKTIVPWYADATSGYTPPSGWAICDGSTLNASQQDVVTGTSWTLPDLRNKFILGATLSKGDGIAGDAVTSSNIDAAAGGPGPKGTGGSNKHLLTQDEIPTGPSGSGGHSIDKSDNVTSGQVPFDNRPNYYGLVYIMKVKY